MLGTFFFSRNKTECLKGVLSICVLLHHIWQKTKIDGDVDVLAFFLQSMGYYSVSAFFFISGYGLYASLENNNRCGKDYLADYQKNRVLPIFVINACLIIIYLLQKCILGFNITFFNVISSFIYGGDIVDNGWYLLCIMVFYEFFFISARVTVNNICTVVLLLTILYMFLAYKFGVSTWWYISSLSFPVGMCFSKFKLRIDEIIYRFSGILILVFAALWLCCFYVTFSASPICTSDIGLHFFLQTRPYLNFAFMLVHGLVFTILIFLLMTRIDIENKYLTYLSSIYLEVYVIQGFVFNWLRNPLWVIENEYVFALLSFVGSIVLAILLHPFFSRLLRFVKKQKLCLTTNKNK